MVSPLRDLAKRSARASTVAGLLAIAIAATKRSFLLLLVLTELTDVERTSSDVTSDIDHISIHEFVPHFM